MSCYYHATHVFEEKEVIPIGRPFKNTQILLLNEQGEPVKDGETGRFVFTELASHMVITTIRKKQRKSLHRIR